MLDDFYTLSEILYDDLHMVALCLKELGFDTRPYDVIYKLVESSDVKRFRHSLERCLGTDWQTMKEWRFKNRRSLFQV